MAISAKTQSVTCPSTLSVDGRNDIKLRAISVSDALELLSVLKDNQGDIEEFRHLRVNGITLAKVEEAIKTLLEYIKSGERIQYRIINVANDKIAGSVTLYDINLKAGTAGLGVWVSRHFQGKGYASAACKQLVQHGFNRLGLVRIILEIHPDNVKSEAVAKNLGANLTGKNIKKEKINDREFTYRIWEIENHE